MHSATALATLALLTSTALAQTPSLVTFPQGGGQSAFISLARGTNEVVASGPNFSRFVYRNGAWSQITALGLQGTVSAISADGQSYVGEQANAYSTFAPGTGIRAIGVPAGRTLGNRSGDWVGNNAAYAVSNFTTGSDTKPYKWTQATGWQLLPSPGFISTRVMDVRADGRAMVGQAQSFTDYQGYIYREGQGITLLGSEVFPTAINEAGNAYLANRIIPQTVFFTAQLTVDSVTTDLGVLPGFVGSSASDLSADANMVVGLLRPDTLSSTAFVWTQDQGMRTITDVAASYGFSFPAHQSIWNIAVSADGTTIAGTLENGPVLNAFVLTIPTPASLAVLGLSAFITSRRRR